MNIEKPFCDFSFFMRHGCHGCINSRRCEEYERRIKRNSNNNAIDSSDHISGKKEVTRDGNRRRNRNLDSD